MQPDIELQPETIQEIKRLLASSINRDMEQHLPPQYQEVIDYANPKKISHAAHEILFDITAQVFEENEKGETIGTKEVLTKKFHIPVPIDKDYHLFMKTFFEHIETCLLASTKLSYGKEDANG